MTPTFQGEVQFRRYSDTSTQGAQIVFNVADREDLEPFVGKEGKRFMAVLIEVGDDEQPVEPVKNSAFAFSRWAALRCQQPRFRDWVVESFNLEEALDEQRCAAFMREKCEVHSRAVFDSDKGAVERLRAYFMVPWERHNMSSLTK